jgi:hypothetical protein
MPIAPLNPGIALRQLSPALAKASQERFTLRVFNTFVTTSTKPHPELLKWQV